MNVSMRVWCFTAGLLLASAAGFAQTGSDEGATRVSNQIRNRIRALSNYGPFDFVKFEVAKGSAGYKVGLEGWASRPTLRDSAERVVKQIETVESVENRIEVLPNSRQDEDLRLQAYVRIYYHPSLSRYNPNRGAPVYGSRAGWERAAFLGISKDPPTGPHPISIIVKNGSITLAGVVDNEGDKNIATMQANQTPGSFKVTNELVVLNPARAKK
jgi:osmotically-inducible protein OsmY